jgi:hypothetical protein
VKLLAASLPESSLPRGTRVGMTKLPSSALCRRSRKRMTSARLKPGFLDQDGFGFRGRATHRGLIPVLPSSSTRLLRILKRESLWTGRTTDADIRENNFYMQGYFGNPCATWPPKRMVPPKRFPTCASFCHFFRRQPYLCSNLCSGL